MERIPDFLLSYHWGSTQGVTKRCRLSLLTNSALAYEPKCEGGVAGSQPMSTAVHMEPKYKIWRSNSIFNLWIYINRTLLASVGGHLTGYTGSRKTKREGGGATVAVSADGDMRGRTQIIRNQEKSDILPFHCSMTKFPLLLTPSFPFPPSPGQSAYYCGNQGSSVVKQTDRWSRQGYSYATIASVILYVHY